MEYNNQIAAKNKYQLKELVLFSTAALLPFLIILGVIMLVEQEMLSDFFQNSNLVIG